MGAGDQVKMTIISKVADMLYKMKEGVFIATAGIKRKTAERKLSEQVPVASEKKYHTIVENMSDVVYLVDVTGKILFITSSAKSLTGYEQSEMIGHNIQEFTCEKDFKHALNNIRYAISEKKPTSNEYRLLHKDGNIVWMQTTTRPVIEGDNVVALQGSFRDITEYKKTEEALRVSEQKFRLLVETSSDWIWEVNVDGIYTYASPQVMDLIGYSPEEVVGRKPFDFMAPDESVRVTETFSAFVLERKAFAGIENVNIRKDGRRVVLETSGVPMLDVRGNFLGYRGIDRDITDRKHAEDVLRMSHNELELRVKERTAELEKRARQLARLSSELTLAEHQERSRIAKVLHDHLQQLLVGARINQEILIDEIDGASKTTGERVLNLINLSIQEMRSLNAELAPPVLDSGDLSSSLEWLSRWMHENQSFDVEVHAIAPIVLERKDLAVLLFQSIRELLLNVLKHSGVKSATIKLDVQNGNLRAVISDRGVGFSPDRVRECEASNQNFGLISIRERLLYLGGRFEIDSAPNAGATISLIVPLEKENSIKRETEDSRSESRSIIHADIRRHPGKTRIMLVDDHPVMRDGLSRMLNTFPDIEIVAEASDGKEAVSLARNIVPDVVLMDINMPNMDGLEATRIIHSELPQVRIIGLSMYDEAGQSKAMLDAGASAYRAKSGSTDRLLAAVRGDSN